MFGNSLWLTPDTPTLVDMPKGTIVYPDMSSFESFAQQNDLYTNYATVASNDKPKVIVNNDYRKLEREMRYVGELIKRFAKQQHQDARDAQYEAYKQRMI